MNRTPSPSAHDPLNGQPITEWMQGYQRGDDFMQHLLWKAVSDIILNYARKQLKTRSTIEDPQGIANEAFFQLLKGLRADAFKILNNRHDLLQILYKLCECRATDSKRRANAKKRGGGQIVSGGHLCEGDVHSHISGRRTHAAEELIVEESFRELLELVIQRYQNRPEIEIFQRAYMSGMTDSEIANHGLKDQTGKILKSRQIQRRRIEMLEFLKRQVCDEE